MFGRLRPVISFPKAVPKTNGGSFGGDPRRRPLQWRLLPGDPEAGRDSVLFRDRLLSSSGTSSIKLTLITMGYAARPRFFSFKIARPGG